MRQRNRPMKVGTLVYDSQLDRFALDIGDEWTPLHCGQALGLRVGARYVWGRIEMDRSNQWYVIFSTPSGRDTTLTLRTGCRNDAKVYW